MAKPGAFASLNLGPKHLGSGAYLPLNLGVEWDDQPVEPVIRGIRQQSRLAWTRPDRRRTLSQIGWGGGASLTVQTSAAWALGERVGRDTAICWAASDLARQEVSSAWRSEMGWVGSGTDLRWAQQGLLTPNLALPWGGRLRSVGLGCQLPWRALATARESSLLRWRGWWPKAGAITELAWRVPPASRRYAKLPWGAAAKLSWGVRPGPGPDPDPDPESPFPRGDQVCLNLGCSVVGVLGLVPLNLGVAACYVVRPQRRTYVVINTVSLVRLPDRVPIEVTRISLGASRGTWGWTFDIELADPQQLALLKPTAAGPRQFEVNLNGYVWTGIIESFQKQREFNGGGVRLSGRSRTALLAAPYAPARVKATTEERSMAQLVAEELADTGFTSTYDTVDWNVPAGAWFYDASTPLDAISALAEASGGVVQSDPAALAMRVRAAYPASPWDWRTTQPDHVLQEDIVLTESLQMRSAPLYDAVVVTGELAGKGVTCKVRKSGEEGRLYAQQVSSPLITVSAAGAERGRNILCDRGEQAAVDLTVPLFAKPLKAGEVGLLLPLDLVEVVGANGTWHGQCESLRIEVSADDRAVVIEQTATLERHYTDAD